jgi:hypothetical protein
MDARGKDRFFLKKIIYLFFLFGFLEIENDLSTTISRTRILNNLKNNK